MDGTKSDKDHISSSIYGFGEYLLNTKERKIFSAGRYVDITPKAFDILQSLVEHAGNTVSKDELLETVWEGNFVEESNLAVHVSKLRKVLGPDDSDEFIKTISGSGYRFVSKVAEIAEDKWETEVENAIPLFKDLPVIDDDCESVAIMPLENENGDIELDYLADGITEALINNISCRPNLRVIARNTVFRFKDKEIDVRDVGRRLKVTAVLTGRVRMVGENIMVGVELAKVSDASQLWGVQFNRPFAEILEIQDKITNSIADSLDAELEKASKKPRKEVFTSNTESYRLYLKGKYLINNRRSVKDVNMALNHFTLSVSLDPQNAKSYVAIADCLRVLLLYQQISRDDALRQIDLFLSIAGSINDVLPEYYLVRGYVEMFMHFDFEKAETNFQRSLNLNPNSSKTHLYFARLLIYSGRLAEGLKEASESARLDPISYSGNKNLAKIFLMTEQYENAVNRLEECLELEPSNFETLVLLGVALTELGQTDKAIENFNRALEIQDHIETTAMLGYAYAKCGNETEAKKLISKLKKASQSRYVPSTFIAVIYAALRDMTKTFVYLDKALDERYLDLVALNVDPRWKNVRDDERFKALQKKLKHS